MKTVTPLFGHGPVQMGSRDREPDLFGGASDDERIADGQARFSACVDFMRGNRADPALTQSEHSELMAAAPYERRAMGLRN